MPMEQSDLILVTGATGYVGGRLLHVLERQGRRLRCLARRPEMLRPRVHSSTVVMRGDLLDPATLTRALEGVHTAFYLSPFSSFHHADRERERVAAWNFAQAAGAAHIRQIVLLSAWPASPPATGLDAEEIGLVLRGWGTPVIEFSAPWTIGAGSLLFETIQSLAKAASVLPQFRWMKRPIPFIAIEDLLEYLLAPLESEPGMNRSFVVAAPEAVSLADLVRECARQSGRKPAMVSIPLASRRCSSLLLSVATPMSIGLGRAFVEEIQRRSAQSTVVASQMFPHIEPRDDRECIARALQRENEGRVIRQWTETLAAGTAPDWSNAVFGARQTSTLSQPSPLAPSDAFRPIRRIGGEQGWYFLNSFWTLLGLLDRLTGGIGMRRGRPDPEIPFVGAPLDGWRVHAYESNRKLRLVCEMKLPGRLWLEFEVENQRFGCVIRQTVQFDPAGWSGRLHWRLTAPLRHLLLRGTLRALVRAGLHQVQTAREYPVTLPAAPGDDAGADEEP